MSFKPQGKNTVKGTRQRNFDRKNPKQAEQRMEVLISSIDDILVTYDRQWRFSFVNESAARVMGMPREELLGKNIWELFPDEVGKKYYSELHEAFRTKKTIISVQHFALIDKWFETHIYPFDEGVTVFASDITARKRAEELLSESEKKYQSLFANIDQGSCIIEVIFDTKNQPQDLRFLEVNNAFEKHTGLKNVVGRRMKEINPLIEQNWFDIYGNVALSGNPIRFENKSDQLRRWFDLYAFRIGKPEERKVGIIFTDITELKKSLDMLKKNEASLADAQSIAKTGSWEFDLSRSGDVNRHELRWSSEMYRLFGYRPGEVNVTSALFFSIVHPDDHGKIRKAIDQVLKNKKKYSVTHRIILRDGSERVIEETGKAVFDKNGKRIKIIGTAHDITQQKKAEEALQRSEFRYKTLTELTPVGIYETDVDGYTTYVNQRMCDILGLTREQALGEGWLRALHSDDNERVLREWWEAAKENREFVSEYRFITPKGKVTWVHGTGIALSANRKVTGYIGTVVDITDQRIARERLEYFARLSQSITDAVISTDEQYVIRSWNKGAEALYGWKEHEVVGKNSIELLATEYFPGTLRNDVIEGLRKNGSWQGEVRQKKKNGEEVHILAVLSQINNSEGNATGVVAVNRDITERKKLEQQKDEFISIASHELKTPVTSVKAYTQILQSMLKRQGDETSVTHLGKMDAQLNKLTDLIGDLLDVTKIQAGKLQFTLQYFDFDALVSETVDTMQLTADKHSLLIKGKTGKKVYGDKDRIGQVLTNFLSNAIKYSPDAKKVIVKTNVENDTVVLCVRDFGVGIAKDKQEKIFERFFRVNGPNSHTFSGLGLGLYISAEIITRLGGRIWVVSEGNRKGLPAGRQGSSFFFSLPIKKRSIQKKIHNGVVK